MKVDGPKRVTRVPCCCVLYFILSDRVRVEHNPHLAFVVPRGALYEERGFGGFFAIFIENDGLFLLHTHSTPPRVSLMILTDPAYYAVVYLGVHFLEATGGPVSLGAERTEI